MKHKRINIEQQFDNIDIDKVWDFAFHEENSFNSRLQSFIAIHALLITAIALHSSNNKAFVVALIFLGIIIGFVWLLLQVRNSITLSEIENILDDNDELYKQIFSSKMKWYQIDNQIKFISWFLPCTFISGWILFLIYILCGGAV